MTQPECAYDVLAAVLPEIRNVLDRSYVESCLGADVEPFEGHGQIAWRVFLQELGGRPSPVGWSRRARRRACVRAMALLSDDMERGGGE